MSSGPRSGERTPQWTPSWRPDRGPASASHRRPASQTAHSGYGRRRLPAAHSGQARPGPPGPGRGPESWPAPGPGASPDPAGRGCPARAGRESVGCSYRSSFHGGRAARLPAVEFSTPRTSLNLMSWARACRSRSAYTYILYHPITKKDQNAVTRAATIGILTPGQGYPQYILLDAGPGRQVAGWVPLRTPQECGGTKFAYVR